MTPCSAERIHMPHDNCPGRDHIRCPRSERGEIHPAHPHDHRGRAWWCHGQVACANTAPHHWHVICPGVPCPPDTAVGHCGVHGKTCRPDTDTFVKGREGHWQHVGRTGVLRRGWTRTIGDATYSFLYVRDREGREGITIRRNRRGVHLFHLASSQAAPE